MWPTRMKRASSWMRRIRCWPAAQNGRGAVEHFGVEKRVRILYGTFSKAFGALGGFVCGSKETLDYLRFYSHPYVYSCALPPVVVAAILKALELGTSRPELRTRLWENADYFHKQLTALGIDTGNSTTYIMPLVIGDRERMYRLGHELRHARSLGGAGRLSGGAAGQDLLPGLRDGEPHPRRFGRGAQYSLQTRSFPRRCSMHDRSSERPR